MIGCLSVLFWVSNAGAALYKVTVESLAPANGVRFTPVWVGFHDGSVDNFNSGSSASSNLEMLAEDGNPAGIAGSFSGQTDGVIFGPGTPPIYLPGEKASMVFDLDTSSDTYFSFLSMVVPSNDAFIGNDDPMAYNISPGGVFQPTTIDILGSTVWDAGTEENDEIPMNTALLGQMTPNTGTTEGGVVGLHSGFMAGGNILSAYPGADFTAPDYAVARIKVQAIPEPASFALVAIGGAMAIRLRKRKWVNT